MRPVQILLLSIILPLYICTMDEGQKKIQTLLQLSENSDDFMVQLDRQAYHRYILQEPRPYIFVLLFTASNFDCKPCQALETEISGVVYSLREHLEDYSPEKDTVPIFFGKVDYADSNSQALFELHNFQSAPRLFLSFPGSLKSDKKQIKIPREDEYEDGMYGDVYSEKILEFINLRTRNNFEMRSHPLMILVYLIILVSVIVGGLIFAIKIRKILLNPIAWFVASILVYFICISGTIYGIIHNIPFANTNQQGQVEYIAPGQRSQYAGEGFLLGFLMTMGGLSLVALSYMDLLKKRNNQIIFAVVMLLASMYFIWQVWSIYVFKSHWYAPTFFPPGHYISGSLMLDQGNSF